MAHDDRWVSWSGTVSAHPSARFAPATEDELATVLHAAHRERRHLKVVGSGHSCSAIAASDGADLVSLHRFDRLLGVDRARRRVTFQAGARLRDVHSQLASLGLALPNLPAIDAPTLAGAIATGTHGSGMAFGGFADAVVGARLLAPSGETVDIDGGTLLEALRTHLGCLGVVTQLTLQCVDAFDLRCHSARVPLDAVLDRLDEHHRDTFGFWWFPYVDQVITRAFAPAGHATARRSPLAAWWSGVVVGNRAHEALLWAAAAGRSAAARAVRRQLDVGFGRVACPEWDAGPSYRVLTSTILIRQRVLEYAIPYARTGAAIRALRDLIATGPFKVAAPIDVRFSRGDTAWLGLSYGRASCYIGVVAYRPFGREPEYEPFFRATDGLLRSYDGRPHWGKIHYQDAASLRPLYPRFDDFLAQRARLDPRGVLLNPYLRRVLGAS